MAAGLEQGGGSSESPPHGEEKAIAAACAFSPALAPGLPRCTPGDPAGDGLAQAEEEEGRGHEVQREHVELDADPQHQRDPEDHAEEDPAPPPPQQQDRRRQIRQPVHDQQGKAGKQEVPEQHLRKGQLLKEGQHGVHAQGRSAGVEDHAHPAGHRADADEERPENQDLPGDVRFSIHITMHSVCLDRGAAADRSHSEKAFAATSGSSDRASMRHFAAGTCPKP